MTACRPQPAPVTPTSQREVFAVVPKAESTTVGPVGSGTARCSLFVYPWATDGHCKVQVNHCGLDSATGKVVCLSLMDERRFACGAHSDVCGQRVRCSCPVGAAEPVPDAPGMVVLCPTRLGQELRSEDGRCQGRTSTLPGGAQGPPPAPCIVALKECDAAGKCNERTEMLSCGVRSELCSRPVRCECPAP